MYFHGTDEIKKYELMYILYIMKKDSYIDLFLVRNINFWIKYLS